MSLADRESDKPGSSLTHILLLVIISLIAVPLLLCGGCIFLVLNGVAKRDAEEAKAKQNAVDEAKGVGSEVFRNGIVVKVTAIAVEPIRFRVPFTTEEKPETENVIRINIEIYNRSGTRRINYDSYVSMTGIGTDLKDEFGNVMPQRNAWSKYETGHGGRMDPGQSASDLIVFEMPIAKAEKLTLTLRGRNIEADTDLHFTFKKADWLPRK